MHMGGHILIEAFLLYPELEIWTISTPKEK